MGSSFDTFFKDITGFTPYNYQSAVAYHLLNGKNVILSVPTGAGKTYASVAPFLFAQNDSDSHFPQKMIYSLPLRALTNSIYNEIASNKRINEHFPDIARQTGEFSDDPYFEKQMIFSTIDQTLSNFLSFPLALSQREANINAGALIGSYLVFDEFHLLEPRLSMATTIQTLKLLGNLSPFCLMTATLSNSLKENLQNELCDVKVIDIDDFPEDQNQVTSFIPPENKKQVNVIDRPIEAGDIISAHKQQTIVICNRVESVQNLYKEVSQAFENSETTVFCLHSRFFDEDRKEKERQIEEYFGKGKAEDAILISTQVIEAGMDISCDVMHTEISPANSFLQRAGRCARFEGETGDIYVYGLLGIDEQEKINIEPENNEDAQEINKINKKFLPYRKELIEATFDFLQQHVKTLDGNKPKEIIEEVQSQQEEEFFAKIKTDNFNYSKIKKAWQDCEKSNYRDTIRDIQNVEVCLVSDQNFEEVKNNPYQLQTISIFKWSLVGWLKKSEEENDFEDWLAKELTESVILDMGDEGEYDLTEVKDYQKLPSLVYLNADHFGYSPEIGFNRDFPDTFQNTSPVKNASKIEESAIGLQKDTFLKHNLGLINCFEQEYLPQSDFVLKELITYLEQEEISREDLINLLYLMFILHDYGKLNKDWQKPMQKYQAKKEGDETGQILAHTDYSKEKLYEKELSKKAGLHKRPSHAPIGAHVFLETFENYHDEEELEELKIAMAYAIGKHHSSKIDGEIKIPEYSIPESCYNAFQELLAKFEFKGAFSRTGYPGRLEEQIDEGSPQEMIPYFFFVRILRLCDQKATKNLRKYLNNG